MFLKKIVKYEWRYPIKNQVFLYKALCNFINSKHTKDTMTKNELLICKSSTKGYGLVASKDFKSGKRILTVDQNSWAPYSSNSAINDLMIKNEQIFQKVQQTAQMLSLNDKQFEHELTAIISLALKLLQEFESNEKNDPYISYLEGFIRTNNKHALSIDDNTFNYFKGTSCWVGIKERRDMYQFISRNIFQEVSTKFLEVFGLILSRVDLCDYSLHNPFTLVPYLDFVNHSSTPNALCRYEENNCSFVLESTQDICEGEEIFINYGNNKKTNNSLIFLYGFANKENGNDQLVLNIPIRHINEYENNEAIESVASANSVAPSMVDWHSKYGKITDGHMNVTISIETMLQFSPEIIESMGGAMCKLLLLPNPVTFSKQLAPELRDCITWFHKILNISRLCISKNEKQFIDARKFTIHDFDKEAITYILDIVEKRINYAKECDNEIVDKKDSSITEWHNLSKFVKMREINALTNFFRSFVSYLTQLEKMGANKLLNH